MELLLEEYGAVVFFIIIFVVIMDFFKDTAVGAANGTLMENFIANQG